MDSKIAFPDCEKCQRLYEKWVEEDYPQPGKDYDPNEYNEKSSSDTI